MSNEPDERDELIRNLELALATRSVTGMAVGIVMERFGMPQDRAFAYLARLSQQTNVKLRVLAQDLVEHGTLPGEAHSPEPASAAGTTTA